MLYGFAGGFVTPTKKEVEQEIKRLRDHINSINDSKKLEQIIESRLAYFAETLLRWALEDTIDWNLPLEETIEETNLILQDIEAKSV